MALKISILAFVLSVVALGISIYRFIVFRKGK